MSKVAQYPDGWVEVEVREIGEVVTGNTPPKSRSEFYGGDVPLVKPPELKSRSIETASDSLTHEGAKHARVVPPGTTFVSCIGNLGKTGIAKRELAFNQQINAVVPSSSIDNSFVFYYFQTFEARDCLEKLSSATTVAIVNKGKFETIPFPLPPLNEQKRIVEKLEQLLSELDKAVDALKSAQQKLKTYRRAVLKAAVEGELSRAWREENKERLEPADELLQRILSHKTQPSDTEDGYNSPGLTNLPNGWCFVEVDKLVDFVTSGSRGWAKYYSDDGALFLRVGNLNHDAVSLDLSNVQRVNAPKSAEGARTRIQLNDILVSITADVGMVAHINEDFGDAYINQHVSLVRPASGKYARFLAWALASSPTQKQFQNMQYGATKSGLRLDQIRLLKVPFPSLEEQNYITDEIEKNMSIIDANRAVIDKKLFSATLLRQSILQKAFSGQLVPQDPNDEPASVLLERIRAEREAAGAKGKRGKKKTTDDSQPRLLEVDA